MRLPPGILPLSVFCLLLAFLQAAGTTIDITTPMPAPEWATLQRRILADSEPAVKAFFAKYYDERGYFSTSSDGAPTMGRTMPSRTRPGGRSCMRWGPATRSSGCI